MLLAARASPLAAAIFGHAGKAAGKIKIAKTLPGLYPAPVPWQRGLIRAWCHPGTWEPAAGSGFGVFGLFWRRAPGLEREGEGDGEGPDPAHFWGASLDGRRAQKRGVA